MALQNLYSLELRGRPLRITGGTVGVTLQGEYNRVFSYCKDVSFAGSAELNGRHTVKGGFSLGRVGNEIEYKAFTGGEIALPFRVPLYTGLVYIYNGLPGYETHTHSLLPLAALKGKWAGIALGPGMRFTSFFNEPPLFESMLSFSGYVNLVMTETLRLGLRCGNFNNFTAGNMGAYSVNLNSTIRLAKQCALINEIELLQTGSVALTANLYGIVYRGGLVVSW